MPKHLRRGVKREHHILKGIDKKLEEIAGIDGVEKVIPGRIYPSESRGFEIKVSRETRSGLKLIAKSNGSVQDVFVIISSNRKEEVRREIEKRLKE